MRSSVKPRRLDLGGVLDVMRFGAGRRANLGKTTCVAGVLAADDDHRVDATGKFGRAILTFLSRGADGVDDAQIHGPLG